MSTMTRYCTRCGAENAEMSQYCISCQSPLSPMSGYQPLQSVAQGPVMNWQQMGADKKLPAGICGILIGSLGIHKFILGYRNEGLIMLLVTVLTCFMAAPITGIIGLVEGIIYITKSDEDFVNTYIQQRRGWF